MKIAVFVPNWVGDAIMATPALRMLRERCPEAEIVGIVRFPVGDALAGLDLFDRLMAYEPQKAGSKLKGWRWLRALRGERFDMAILLTNSWHTAFLAWMGGCRQRIGLDRDKRRLMLTTAIPAPLRKRPHPVSNDYMTIVRAALGEPNEVRDDEFNSQFPAPLEVAVTSEDEAEWQIFWRSLSPALRCRGLVCLNTGGAFGPAKNWPIERFAALAVRMAEDWHKTVLVICGPAERENARKIVELAQHGAVLSLSELPPSIGRTKAALRSAELLVTTDSGPRHLAIAAGIPVVTLFGPTNQAWSESFAPLSVNVQVSVDCGPCQKRTCPLGHHRCMQEISVEMVLNAAEGLKERLTILQSA